MIISHRFLIVLLLFIIIALGTYRANRKRKVTTGIIRPEWEKRNGVLLAAVQVVLLQCRVIREGRGDTRSVNKLK